MSTRAIRQEEGNVRHEQYLIKDRTDGEVGFRVDPVSD
jgi:hypothetical protein